MPVEDVVPLFRSGVVFEKENDALDVGVKEVELLVVAGPTGTPELDGIPALVQGP